MRLRTLLVSKETIQRWSVDHREWSSFFYFLYDGPRMYKSSFWETSRITYHFLPFRVFSKSHSIFLHEIKQNRLLVELRSFERLHSYSLLSVTVERAVTWVTEYLYNTLSRQIDQIVVINIILLQLLTLLQGIYCYGDPLVPSHLAFHGYQWW